MAIQKVLRGRPKLAVEDNETREKILNTAQTLFAKKGYSKVSLRELTNVAGVNLASVNYYFGSKDKLLVALVQRAAKTIYRERMKLLKEAENKVGSREELVRSIIYTLLCPTIFPKQEIPGAFLFSTLVARSLSDGPDEVTELMERQTSHLAPYAEALKKVLPEYPMETIFWRLHFILNIEHAASTESNRLKYLSDGLCSTEDKSKTLNEILDFSVSGLLAPL